MTRWREVLLWMGMLFGIVSVAGVLTLKITGAISTRQFVEQGLVGLGCVLLASSALLYPQRKDVANGLAVGGIVVATAALVLFLTT